jgi:hypothetical protein
MREIKPGSNGANTATTGTKINREKSKKVMISVPYVLTGFGDATT